MSYFQALVLGVVQGITEFLPISSSGHLVLFQTLFGLNEARLFVDVLVHVGTLVAVLIYFRQDLKAVLSGLYLRRWKGRLSQPSLHDSTARQAAEALVVDAFEGRKFLHCVLLATIPTALIGVVFKGMLEEMFQSLRITGGALVLTGFLLVLTRGRHGNRLHLPHMTNLHAVIIGIAQGLAIVPGLSRSGATIAVALLLGFDATFAVKFSFLLSIPAIFGALVVQLATRITLPDAIVAQALLAALGALISGYLALGVLVRLTVHHRLSYFSVYCWTLGILLLYLGSS